jgi:hypothetical protein
MSDIPPDAVDAELARAMRPRRVPPVTAALLVAVLLALAFVAGVLVQKRHDKGITGSNGTSVARLFAARGAGTGAGGLGGFGAAAPAGAAGSAASPTGVPAVIGDVVRVQGTTLTVRNLGGQVVTVRTTSATTVTGAASVAALRPGEGVAVSGTRAADGTVRATAIRVTP